MITIVDYGMGNLASILNLCRYLGLPAQLATTPEEVSAAAKLLLPGVGAFAAGMQRLTASGLRPALEERALRARVPVLGICLGMQLLTRHSEEGDVAGLGWLPAHTVQFRAHEAPRGVLRIPHMGWSIVTPYNGSPLFEHLPPAPRFYFVHSYHVVCDASHHVAGMAEYGRVFTAAVQCDNLFGTQFHPEKSHRFGMQLLRNFARL